MRLIDLTGQKFGRLTVLYQTNSIGNNAAWQCSCSCGNVKSVRSILLRRGVTKSCGCIRKTHGHASGGRSKVYCVWDAMLRRCTTTTHHAYKDYGGRGIAVCDRWLSFENFYNDMGDAPAGLSLERKNNDLGYSLDNCIWARRTEQQRNMRGNRILVFRDRKASIIEWSEDIGWPHYVICSRLRSGWSVEKALCTPWARRKSYV